MGGRWFRSTRWEASRDLWGLRSALCVRFREAAFDFFLDAVLGGGGGGEVLSRAEMLGVVA